MGPLYLAAMDAIHAVSPTTTFLVEGCGQTAFPGMNWGDGFVTDPSLISQYGLSDPRAPFFDPLLSKAYLNNVGISPHVYPPSVTFQGTVRLSWQADQALWAALNNTLVCSHMHPVSRDCGCLWPCWLAWGGCALASW